MKATAPFGIYAAGAMALAFPGIAQAHSSSVAMEGWAAGLVHPLLGWDHLLAMIAVGLWAAQLGGRARWLVPAAFVSVMACGAALGARGFVPPGVEPMILASVLVFGLLIAGAVRLPATASGGLVGLFALFHGLAHGAEMQPATGAFTYAAGLVIATAALHAFGLLVGRGTAGISGLVPRVLGGACAAAGVALLVS